MCHSTLKLMSNSYLPLLLAKMLLAAMCMMITPFSFGEVSSSVSLVSRYVFRGVVQADEKPAMQMGLDGVLGKGIYTGIWASRVETQEQGNVELNGYLGIQHQVNEVIVDLGYLRYRYQKVPSNPNAREVYLKAHWQRYSALFYHDMGGPRSNYLQMSADYPLPYDLGLHLSVGRQSYGGDAGISSYSNGLVMVSYPLRDSLWTGGMWSQTWGGELGKMGEAQGVLFIRVSLP